MIRSRSNRSFRRPTAVALISACALAAVGGACGRDDPSQRAVDQANLRLESISTAGANPVPSVARRKDVFNEVVTLLKPIADNSEASLAPTAAMLMARSKSGLGEIASKDAAGLEDQFRSQITVASGQLDQWISQHSTAAALRMYDPAKDLADLDKQSAARLADADRSMKEKAAQERVVAEIQARSEKAHASAKKERDREAGIRKKAEGLSQTERESLIQNAVEASRAADAFDKQSSELKAEAAKESPRIVEIAQLVDQLQRQVESLKKSKEGIKARAAAAQQQADAAAAEANAVGGKIKAMLDGLAKIREAAATPTQESIKQYAAAAAGAKKATATPVRETKTAATTALGGYQQCIGDVLANKARSMAVYAATLDAIATATPAVPGASEIATRATAAAAELKTATEEAEAAYEAALGAYKQAGGTNEVKARMEAVTKTLEELNALRRKPVAEPKPAAVPADKPSEAKPAAAAPTAPAPVAAFSDEQASAVQAEVRAMLKEFAAASAAGDFARALAHVDFANEGERKAVEAGLPVMIGFKTLDAACTAKFGKNLGVLAAECQVPSVKGNPMMPMLGMVGKGAELGSIDADKVTIKAVSAENAELSVAESPTTMRAVKKDGVWKLGGLGAVFGGPMAAQLTPMLKGLGDAFTKVTAGIKESKYAKSDDMLIDLSAQLMGMMGGMMGGGPGGPGGGGPKPRPGGAKPPGGGGGGG